MRPQSRVQSGRTAVQFGARENGSPLFITRVLSLPQWFPNASPHTQAVPILSWSHRICSDTIHTLLKTAAITGRAVLNSQCFGRCTGFLSMGKRRDRLESEEPDSSVSLAISYCMPLGKLLHVSRAHFPAVSEAPSSSKSPLSQIHTSVSWVLKQHCFQKMILEIKHTTKKPQVTKLGDTV